MSEKKLWNKQQDKYLIYLKEQENINKWSQISKKMRIKFGKNSRNQKQCRARQNNLFIFQRYINHLRVKKQQLSWGKHEQQLMIQLHKKIGNKWSSIADNFSNITQNFIKNQFYSLLRKSIRRINKYINQSLRKQYKQFNLSLIFKLASIVDGKLNKNLLIQQQLKSAYTEFLYVLIQLSNNSVSEKLQTIQRQQAFVRILIAPLSSLQKLFFNITKKINRHSRLQKSSTRLKRTYPLIKQAEQSISYNESFIKINQLCQQAKIQLDLVQNFYRHIILGYENGQLQKNQQMTVFRQKSSDLISKEFENKNQISVSLYQNINIEEKLQINRQLYKKIVDQQTNINYLQQNKKSTKIEEQSNYIQNERKQQFLDIDQYYQNHSSIELLLNYYDQSSYDNPYQIQWTDPV